MNEEELKREVEKAVSGDGGEPSAPEEPKKDASQEVKTDTTPEEPKEQPKEEPKATPEAGPKVSAVEGKNADQLQDQINNLNVALKQEREEGKAESEALKRQLTDANALLDRLKGAFAPEPEPEPEPEETQYLTPEQAEELWQQKEQERTQKEEESKKTNFLKEEISTLEKTWDGKEGKPKYDDIKVLEWQKNNEKLYLSPSEAFTAMYRQELIDWEVKQRLSGKKKTEEVETPSSSPGDHEPKETLPKNEQETRAAVMEAMENAEAEQ